MLDGQRVLVTGATGQVARPLAERLADPAHGNEVWAAARFTDPAAKAALEAQGIRTVRLVLGDEDLSALPDVDYVIHAGANTTPESAEQAMRENAEAVGFLMQRYRGAKAFLYVSSSSVYAAEPGDEVPVREDHALGGKAGYSAHYAMSKLAGEGVARYQARALGLPTVIARLDVAYGSAGHGGLPMILYGMMKAGAPFVAGPGGPSVCSLIHEDDIGRQIQRLLAHAQVPARIVNLGGDERVTLEDVIAHVESLTGLRMRIERGASAAWETKVLDVSLRRELAGPCAVAWRDGVRRTLEAREPEALAAARTSGSA